MKYKIILTTLLLFAIIEITHSCKSAYINVLGVKEFNLPKTSKKTCEKLSKSNGIYIFSQINGGEIKGTVIAPNLNDQKYVMISFTQKNNDYRLEKWTTFYSDSIGNFTIKNLPFGNYKVGATQKNSFLSILPEVVISNTKPKTKVIIELKPIN